MKSDQEFPFERGDLAEVANTPDVTRSCGEPLAQIPQDHPVCAFSRHWRDLTGERTLPLRSQFDPVAVPKLLPYIVIAEVERGPDRRRYRNRLVGTRIVEMVGFDPTGLTMEDFIAPEAVEDRRYAYDLATDNRVPVFSERHVGIRERSFVRLYFGLFPFAFETGGQVEQIFRVAATTDTAGFDSPA